MGEAQGGPVAVTHAADGKVESRSCPQCTFGDNTTSWADPALNCGLFVADVRAMAIVRRAEASSTKVSLTRRLQKVSPTASGMNSYSLASMSSAGDPLGSRGGLPRQGSRDARSRRDRWGGVPVAPDSSLPYQLDHKATAAYEAAPRQGHVQNRAQGQAKPASPVAVFVSSPPSPQMPFRLEPIGRSPSPVPKGYDI